MVYQCREEQSIWEDLSFQKDESLWILNTSWTVPSLLLLLQSAFDPLLRVRDDRERNRVEWRIQTLESQCHLFRRILGSPSSKIQRSLFSFLRRMTKIKVLTSIISRMTAYPLIFFFAGFVPGTLVGLLISNYHEINLLLTVSMF